MKNLSPSEKKRIKNELKHINGCFNVFKLYCIKHEIQDEKYIQLMLKNYLIDKNKLISENDIERCTKELDELH